MNGRPLLIFLLFVLSSFFVFSSTQRLIQYYNTETYATVQGKVGSNKEVKKTGRKQRLECHFSYEYRVNNILYYESSLFIDDTASNLNNLVKGHCVSLNDLPKTGAPVSVNYTVNPKTSYIIRNFPVGILIFTILSISALVLSYRASRRSRNQ